MEQKTITHEQRISNLLSLLAKGAVLVPIERNRSGEPIQGKKVRTAEDLDRAQRASEWAIQLEDSRILCVDLDRKNGKDGPATWSDRGMQRSPCTQTTKSGGTHDFWTVPEGMPQKRLIGMLPGVDLLSKGIAVLYDISEVDAMFPPPEVPMAIADLAGMVPNMRVGHSDMHEIDIPIEDYFASAIQQALNTIRYKCEPGARHHVINSQVFSICSKLYGTFDTSKAHVEIESFFRQIRQYAAATPRKWVDFDLERELETAASDAQAKPIRLVQVVREKPSKRGKKASVDLVQVVDALRNMNICVLHEEDTWMKWTGSKWIRLQGAPHYEIWKAMLDAGDDSATEMKASKLANLLRVDSRLRFSITSFDVKNILPLANGILDLDTGEFRPGHHPSDYNLSVLNYSYDSNAKSALFEEFLREITAGNKDLESYLQWLMAYCLTRRMDVQRFWVFEGSGANGKSTLLSIMMHVLGEYSTNINPEAVLAKGNYGSQEYHRAKLNGPRLATLNEMPAKSTLSETIKTLTGGDPLCARVPRQLPFTFIPVCKLILTGNTIPSFNSLDQGFVRRLVTIKFRHCYDPNLPEGKAKVARLLEPETLAAALAWALPRLGEGEPTLPEVIRQDNEAVCTVNHPFVDWFSESVVKDPGHRQRSSAFFLHYKDWLDRRGGCIHGHPNHVHGELCKFLEGQGARVTRTGGVKWVKGLALTGETLQAL